MAPRRAVGVLLAAAAASLCFAAVDVAAAGGPQGFDGFVQSGTCAKPTDAVRVNLKSDADHDVEPYYAKGDTDALGYYGAPRLPGFGLAAVYTDERFSLVITEGQDEVACGDLLEPEDDDFTEVGLALVQLEPVDDSEVQGVAVIERLRMERELNITPTRARILLTSGLTIEQPDPAVDGFDGVIRSGTCAEPTDYVRVRLRSDDPHDVEPYRVEDPDGGTELITYYGAPGARGFGLAAAYLEERFSLVLTDARTGRPVACGVIREPDDDDFVEDGLALVQLAPVDDSGVHGLAMIERIGLERELDVTPTRARIVVFAPPGG